MLIGQDNEGRTSIRFGYKPLSNGNIKLTMDYASEFCRLNRVISDLELISHNLETTPPHDMVLDKVTKPEQEVLERRKEGSFSYVILRTSVEVKVPDMSKFLNETPLERVN